MYKILVLIMLLGSYCVLPTTIYSESAFKDNEESTFCISNVKPKVEVETVDSIIVTLKSEFSSPNSDKSSLFKGFNDNAVEELTHFTNEDVFQFIHQKTFRQIYKINLFGNEKYRFSQYKNKLERMEQVYNVEEDLSQEIELEPDDEYYEDGTLWGLNGTNGINAPQAWNYSTGSTSVRVGVIDTGIANHDDLSTNTVSGWDYYNDNSVTSDDTHSHGTHVAGIIGAVGNNSIGVAGVNWNVSLVPMQCANSNNSFNTSTLVSAINDATNSWGTNNQIDIINYSISGLGTNVAVRSAIQNYPGLFVWASGNETTDIDSRVATNGTFNLSNLISVGALNQDGSRRSTSNYSTNNLNVNVYAPGSNIYSTVLSNSYDYKSGTSMAAPHVTGVAALMLSVHPHLTASQLKTIIVNNSTQGLISIPDGSGGSISQNVNKLNAYSAVSAANNSHSYSDHYTFYSSEKHKAYCECGAYVLRPHAIEAGSTHTFHGHTYGNCINCGALIDLGTTIVIVSGQNPQGLMITENGSYILPNGIYVIVEEDLTAYLDGTLEFHNSESQSS